MVSSKYFSVNDLSNDELIPIKSEEINDDGHNFENFGYKNDKKQKNHIMYQNNSYIILLYFMLNTNIYEAKTTLSGLNFYFISIAIILVHCYNWRRVMVGHK